MNVLLASPHVIGGLSLMQRWRIDRISTLRAATACGLLLMASLVPSLTPAPEAAAQGLPKAAPAAPALPERAAEVAPFIAKMDDQQARATLARVLEERTSAARTDASADMLVGFEQATARLGGRLAEIAAAGPEAASAPSLFWRWLTAGGADPRAPWRVLGGAAIILALCWAAQAAAAAALRPVIRRWSAAKRGDRVEAAVLALRWLAFLAAVATTHALAPELNRPSRLTALAVILTFAGAWIGAGAVTFVLPALHRREAAPAAAGPSAGLLHLALGVFFAGLFGLALLREAGMSADARLLIGLMLWLAFGVLFLLAFARARRPQAASDAEAPSAGHDRLERFLDRHGPLLLKLSVFAILVASALFALLRGPEAIWSGIASFGLLGLLVAALGLTRTPFASAAVDAEPPSPWAATLRRGMRLLVIVGFALALAALWDIDLFHTANTHLGDRLARGIVTVAVTIALAYLVWEVIRTALAQSALAKPRIEPERGEEGGEAPGTRLQTFGPVLRNFLFVAVVTVAAMVCLSSLGVDIGPLLAGAGVIGIALGFGAQTLVRDIISGVFFLAEDAFRVGEYIEIGNTRGTVEGIAIRSLKLRHHRGPVHTVPFGEIKQLTNHSRDWVIMKVEFLLAFDTDLRKVKRIVKEIGKELAAHPELGHALLEPVKSQGVRRMEPTGMVIGLKFMAKPGSEVFVLRREVYQRVRDAFEENGIQFARPQVMVAAPGVGAHAALSPDQLAAAAQTLEPPREGSR
jgi:small-conductance mechanosensitive channel